MDFKVSIARSAIRGHQGKHGSALGVTLGFEGALEANFRSLLPSFDAFVRSPSAKRLEPVGHRIITVSTSDGNSRETNVPYNLVRARTIV